MTHSSPRRLSSLPQNLFLLLGLFVLSAVLVVGGIILGFPAFLTAQFGKFAQQNRSSEFGEQEFTFANAAAMEAASRQEFSNQDKYLINRHGFLIRESKQLYFSEDPNDFANRHDDWTDLYMFFGGSGRICERTQGDSVYITADANLHFYHRLFEMEMEYLEYSRFLPQLLTFNQKLMVAVSEQASQATDENAQASWQRLQVFLAIPEAIMQAVDFSTQKYSRTPAGFYQSLDRQLVRQKLRALTANWSKSLQQLASSELEKVFAANEVGNSPVTLQEHDYTQYQPRGHYNQNSLGQAYFMAMMWLGRNNFVLNSFDSQVNIAKTYDALNLLQVIRRSAQLSAWEALVKPINYLVGNADDLSVADYLPLVPVTFNFSQVEAIRTRLLALPKPKIMSAVIASDDVPNTSKEQLQESTQAFALFSQRFTPDAYIFTSLTQGQELPDKATNQRLPSTPTALMVPAALGDGFAQKQLNVWLKEQAENADMVVSDKMQALSDEFAAWQPADWQANHYVSWLGILGTLSLGNKPTLVSDQAWAAKNLNAYLGSYTELKHDTILYAKQSYAEYGGGGEADECEIPAAPRGYIEPNESFFARLSEVVASNLAFLQTIDDNKDEQWVAKILAGRLENYLKELAFYQEILAKQVNQQFPSDDDYEELRHSFGSLGGLLSPIYDNELTEADVRSSLVTDIATDMVKKQVLYNANGLPQEIILAVDDYAGRRLVRGLTYSYREFTKPLEQKRLTDEIWQAQVYRRDENTAAKLPPQPAWWRVYQAH